MAVNEFSRVGEIKLCDGCGKLYWEDPDGKYAGPHYQLIREEGRDEGTGSAETGTKAT